jgi:hypothetical protein
MILADLSSIYSTALVTLSIGLALWTALVTRRDRREERRDAFVRRWEAAYDAVRDAVLELTAAAQEVMPGEPSDRFRLAQIRLADAVKRSYAPGFIPRAEALARTAAGRVEEQAEEALTEINIAIARAHRARMSRRAVPLRQAVSSAVWNWLYDNQIWPFQWVIERRSRRYLRKLDERKRREAARHVPAVHEPLRQEEAA